MNIIVIGLNHKTADVEIRERLAFTPEMLVEGLSSLRGMRGISEAIILSTCNRVEMYVYANVGAHVAEGIKDFLSRTRSLDRGKLDAALYVHLDDEGVRHVFRVAASLDSMVVGEPQILGQLKDAFDLSLVHKSSGIILNRLMKKAISVGKRVRTQTGIAENAVSIGYAAVELARKIFNNLGNKVFMLLGAGEMAELAARHLTNCGVGEVIVANRTYERGCALAKEFSGRAIQFGDFRKELVKTDIVICSTGAPNYVITHDEMAKIMKDRRSKSVFIIDISVPRNIDPDINRIDNVYLYDIDDLKGVIDTNINQRQKEALKASDIIDEEVEGFNKWLQSLDAVPTIVALREMADDIKKDELTKLFNKLNTLDERDRKSIEIMANSIVNKLVHPPTVALKEGAEDKDTLISTIRKLYGLNGDR
ncbi:MAG: glutamyl-tRNA reductase [Candidatus Magnetobacterium sp. LHC-1]|uniref:Glutamyl-tRNA reductase n=1 Tax=Candidatus Magnetobacterium casense TaxID=1455061 RepID=A0ABS6S1J0_9BACT|nr:glutamyl-tRNA reductase [Candidatus Magnetobacterium casensis]MBF0607771.1 glutamyl-tRNA reductase [Nitrospirota bacterium]MBV6342460.1 glutamyl-tRNA reductase [Candidatus Magnetobacterium casensis]